MLTVNITFISAQVLVLAAWIIGLRQMMSDFGSTLPHSILTYGRRGITIFAVLTFSSWIALGIALATSDLLFAKFVMAWGLCMVASQIVWVHYLAKGQLIVMLFPLKRLLYGATTAKNLAEGEWV